MPSCLPSTSTPCTRNSEQLSASLLSVCEFTCTALKSRYQHHTLLSVGQEDKKRGHGRGNTLTIAAVQEHWSAPSMRSMHSITRATPVNLC
jgi:hypothetical protein